ncbi:MAG: Rqc2 family fibronectin-binding protein [Aggregatilineaceae bacterium]
MYFDAVTVMAVVDELRAILLRGRVQDTVEVDAETIGLEVYASHQRHYVVLSAHQQFARVHLSPEKLRRGVSKPSPLGLLLRRYAEGAWISAIEQPAWERVIVFELDSPEGVFSLIAEPMERRANVLLVRGDGVILDCLRRVGPQENRVRVSLPGKPYEPPPPQRLKRDPFTLTPTLLGDMLDANPGERTREVLTRGVLGVSPLLAKEVVFRATGEANTRAGDTSPRALLGALQEMFGAFRERRWHPGVVRHEGAVTAYAAYPLTHLEGWEPVPGISQALVQYYGPLVGEDAYNAARQPVRQAIAEARARLQKKLESLRSGLQDDATLERLRRSGELLLTYQYALQPGARELRAAYEVDGPELVIPLDPTLTPLENARRYFEQYEKAKRARAGVPELIAATEQELAYLDQLATDLELATNWPEIGEVQEALQRNGYWRGLRTAGPRGSLTGPLKVTTETGHVIWVGRNARQNDQVTFEKGGPADLWLHVRGVPGAHVIIKSGGSDVPPAVIRRAAELAAYYSAARNEARVLVDVTQRKYVHKIKGGKPGMVTYRNETPIEVIPRSDQER